jgi:predicted nucleic-acid-binding Zn-ribbon protein
MKIAREDCPKCGSKNITADYLYCDDIEAWRTITCKDCKFMWNEIYVFDHNEDVVTCATLDF